MCLSTPSMPAVVPTPAAPSFQGIYNNATLENAGSNQAVQNAQKDGMNSTVGAGNNAGPVSVKKQTLGG